MWFLENILSDTNILTTLLVFVTTFILVFWITSRPSDVPPGPLRLPLLGNLLSLVGSDTQQVFQNLRKKYGDIYGIYVGNELGVVLNGYDVICDALLKRGSTFAHRPVSLTGKPEIVFANGKTWKDNRAYVMQAFRDLCFVNRGENLENAIVEELKCFEGLLDKMEKAFDPAPYLSSSFANVMFTILHGYRAGYDCEKFKWYLKHVEESIRQFSTTRIKSKCFPFMKYVPGDFIGANKLKENIANLKVYFAEQCKKNFDQYEEGDRSCLTSILLEPDSPVSRDRIWGVLHEMMAAGSETTATTLSWFLMLIAMYPEKQKKLRAAVLGTIGTAMPSLSDRGNIPYVDATILECLRLGSVVPLSVPHTVIEDISFHGYLIPKESIILPNLASVHMDPQNFPEPKLFRPERFLSSDGTAIVGADKVIPFSLGQRSCLGETIARIELFMYITFLVQKYEIDLSTKPKSMTGILGLTHRPQDYKITLVKREL